jgi:predicted nucleic acid-binding protein
VEFHRELRHDPKVMILPSDNQLFQKGVHLYASRPDKEWSLTDCISFVVMTQQRLTEALTGDRHFEQAGFRALLLSR